MPECKAPDCTNKTDKHFCCESCRDDYWVNDNKKKGTWKGLSIKQMQARILAMRSKPEEKEKPYSEAEIKDLFS